MSPVNYIKLSDLTGNIAKVISANFAAKTFWVIAEITNLKHYPQKNYYFLDLVEKDPVNNAVLTSIKANAWSTAVTRIKNFEQVTGQRFDNNIRLLLQVSVEYHITYGMKLNIHDVDPAFTIGNLEKQKQQTLQQLVARNPGYVMLEDGEYNTFNKQLKLNPVIQRIALIASPNSDGYNDFRHELQHNIYGYTFFIDEYAAQVQGAGMESGIVSRLVEIFVSNKEYDAVVIVRGGGSQTDFLIFDSYELGKAIARFPVPVFTGIGHTRNECIADMMAFRATKTPTKAAASIIEHNHSFEQNLLAYQKQIITRSGELLTAAQLQLNEIKVSISNKSMEILHGQSAVLSEIKSGIKECVQKEIATQRQETEKQRLRIQHAAAKTLTASRYRLDNFSQLIRHLSPETVLKRGYALVYQNGKIITGTENIKEGETIETVMRDGVMESVVKAVGNRQ